MGSIPSRLERKILPALAIFALALAHPAALAAKKHKPPKHSAALPSGPLSAQIENILADPSVRQNHWGIVVTAIDGAPLYALNSDLHFVPASNEKLLTSIAAFELLPPTLDLTTRIVAEGPVAGGVLNGNLAFIGVGDTSLSARVLPYSVKTERAGDPLAAVDALAAQVAAAGVRRITGNILGDDTAFVYQPFPAGWSWDDLQWEEGAPVSALAVNDNVQYLAVLPGAAAGDPPTFTWLPETAHYTIESTARTVAAAAGLKPDIGVYRGPGSHVVRIWGTLPVGSAGTHLALSVEDPALFAAEALRDRLLAHGIYVDGQPLARHRDYMGTPAELDTPSVAQEPFPAQTLLAQRRAPPLIETITVTNKASQNLFAEVLLMQIAKQWVPAGITPSREDGLRAVRVVLARAGVDPGDVQMRDGSGVSQQDLATPRAVAALLRYAAAQPWGAQFRATLPVGGVDGTISGRFTTPDMRGRVQAKTGTLAEVDALSGYVQAASGRTVIFSVLCNGHLPGSGARAAMDRIVTAIAAAE